jgi:hypothetical protein
MSHQRRREDNRPDGRLDFPRVISVQTALQLAFFARDDASIRVDRWTVCAARAVR